MPWPDEKYTSENIVEVQPGDMAHESVQIFRQVFDTLDVAKAAIDAGGGGDFGAPGADGSNNDTTLPGVLPAAPEASPDGGTP